jgi:hypothetical protein
MTDHDFDPAPSFLLRVFRFLGRTLRRLVYLLATLWAFGAIYYDGPANSGTGNLVLACGWAGITLTYFFFLKGALKRALIWGAWFAVVLIPWLTIKPSNDRDWQADWARTGSVTIEGDTVTFHNFRNFDHAPDGTVTERWEDRVVHLSNLQGLDYVHDAFGGDLIAHSMFSFDFGPDGHAVISVETRREKGEAYSEFGGLYKMFELQYLFGDERDLIRVRTNTRKEPVYLYRTSYTPELVRKAFFQTVEYQNRLHEHPRFYNIFTANCSTSYRAQTPVEDRASFDIRILANGKVDELFNERGGFLNDGLSFAELRQHALINEVAEAAHDDPEFSTRIREGRPGFGSPPPTPPAAEDSGGGEKPVPAPVAPTPAE